MFEFKNQRKMFKRFNIFLIVRLKAQKSVIKKEVAYHIR